MRERKSPAIEIELEDLVAGPQVLPKLDGVMLGRLTGFSARGEPLVDFVGNPRGGPVPARSIGPLVPADAGRDVALLFEAGDPLRPLVFGAVHDRVQTPPVEVEADQERLEIRAQREIVLRVGRASITLTRAGKVLIRGAYVSTSSSGVQRIKGGSVQIN